MFRFSCIPYRGWLLVVFLVLFAVSVIGVPWTSKLGLQHSLTVAAVILLIAAGWRRPLSNVSCTLIFLYLLLHLIGARYYYSFVPYDDWTEAIFGWRLNDVFGFERNHYDRLVHFFFGLLLFHPMREIVVRLFRINGVRSFIVAGFMHMAISSAYELIEWLVALTFGPETAESYNGQQGDVWDAHRDTALALTGMIVSAGVEAWLEWKRSRRNAA